MRFELEQTNRGVPNEDLLADMRCVAGNLESGSLTRSQYDETGRYGSSIIVFRMGTWSEALKLAGLQLSQHRNITDQELFENIEALWLALGRQPRYGEVKRPLSQYSTRPYERRFGSWVEALRQFVEWVNSEELTSASEAEIGISDSESAVRRAPASFRHRTRREPSDRQRFRILMRDGFRCRSCGASPIEQRGVELHVDHVLPWSKDGETIDDNLETKCSRCNLGKGAAFHV